MNTLHIHLNNLNQIIRQSGEHLEGNSFYIDGQSNIITDTFATKRSNLIHYSTNAQHILEIGFNGGHSCLLFLCANPTSNIQLFDIGCHTYAKSCYDYLNNAFPNRLNIIWGDSSHTLTNFFSEHKFDLIHIDGSHDISILEKDIKNSMRLLNKTGYIIIDDISFHSKHMIPSLTDFVVNKLINKELTMVSPPEFSNFHIVTQLPQ